MEIINYVSSSNVTVKFENGFTYTTTYRAFKDNDIKTPYCKSVHNVGYLGVGDCHQYTNGILALQCALWENILLRCYDQKTQLKHPTYIGCTVCEEWHNYQNFAKWYDQNYYEIEGQAMHIDKDILIKGNKVYSPETCVFVPQNINALFTKSNAQRGDCPIGVTYRKTYKHKKYLARCNNGKKETYNLGLFNTPEEAFNAYKIFKEKVIKQIAEQYKNKIPNKLYEAMCKYEVEITD